MHSRQDVAYFGVDMTKDPPEPKLTYYNCAQGECIKVKSQPVFSTILVSFYFVCICSILSMQVHKLQCRRTCDFKDLDFQHKNTILLSGERIVLAKCRKAYINDSTLGQLPTESVEVRMVALFSCSSSF